MRRQKEELADKVTRWPWRGSTQIKVFFSIFLLSSENFLTFSKCRRCKNPPAETRKMCKYMTKTRRYLPQVWMERKKLNQYGKKFDTNYPRSHKGLSPNRWEPISQLTPRKHLGSRVEPRCKWSTGEGRSGPANVLGEEKLMKETVQVHFGKTERE